MISYRSIEAADAQKFIDLRTRGLIEVPLAFGASPEDDRFRTVESVHELLKIGPDNVIFGAFDGDTMAGVIGIYRDHHVKARHKMHIWGMYVAPEHRRRGIARTLIDTALEHAKRQPGVEWVNLGVSTTTPGAQALYEGAGFRRWGVEPDALRHDGKQGDEIWMIVRLEDVGA